MSAETYRVAVQSGAKVRPTYERILDGHRYLKKSLAEQDGERWARRLNRESGS